ncbi:MAG: YceI family protein [Kangiellaceae bacterium]|nr:YceI family protein [Kangiellaceae bacterium]MCW8999717.1 YceI family protein [Kangiellaceae bacterium]
MNRKLKITKLRKISLIAIVTALLASCSYLLTPNVKTEFYELEKGQYKLDPTHTSVLFKVQHMQLSTYVGRFDQMQAELDFDPKNIKETKLSARVFTTSVNVNNQSLQETLAEEDWFHSGQYPTADLSTVSVEPTEKENQFIFNANLTLRGKTRPLQLLATFEGGADNLLTGYYTLGFSAKGKILRSTFGMDSYIPLVGDQVNIEIYAEFQQK